MSSWVKTVPPAGVPEADEVPCAWGFVDGNDVAIIGPITVVCQNIIHAQWLAQRAARVRTKLDDLEQVCAWLEAYGFEYAWGES